MGESTKLIRAWMRNGVIVPEPGVTIPDGAELRMELVPEAEQGPIQFTPEEQAEFDAWDKLSDEAWSMIDWGEGEIARDAG
jgi:hypothetical protein